MLDRLVRPEVARSPEFQSALMRILGWVLMMSILGTAALQGAYDIDWDQFRVLFAVHLVWFVGILLHVVRYPRLIPARTYLGILADVSGTSFSIYLSGNPTSPFYLIYVWSYLSQGTRFGDRNLALAAAMSMIAYTIVAGILGGWVNHRFEVGFSLLFLLILPAYQYALIRQLHEAKRAAEAANLARGRFLATITHELRTPLSGVIGMAGLLQDSKLDDEQREYVDAISRAASMLETLIGDVLDLSKIDAHKLEFRQVPFDIRRALLDVARVIEPQSLDKRVELICQIDPEVPVEMEGDELRFRQIFFNLVGNAVKFTHEGEVVLSARVEKFHPDLPVRHLYVVVRDTGIGIPEDKVTQIFDSFWQADSSSTRRYGGTGLGTTIARDLTRLMGGTIGVESREGRGSTFWVRLPLSGRGAELRPQPPEVLKERRVVCVEHNATAALAMQETLEYAGMHVVLLDQVEGLRSLGKGMDVADLVILSDSPARLDLPGMVLQARRKLGRDLPVLILHYGRWALHTNDAHLALLRKPYCMRELWNSLESLLEGCSRTRVDAHNGQADKRAAAARGARILVAEDEAINARLIHTLLVRGGHNVMLMRDGETALQAAREGDFDLAMIDLCMPGMDGIDFTRAYREYEAARADGRHMPIVALTANVAEQAREQCLEAGMDEFLTKPIDPATLAEVLSRFGAGSA